MEDRKLRLIIGSHINARDGRRDILQRGTETEHSFTNQLIDASNWKGPEEIRSQLLSVRVDIEVDAIKCTLPKIIDERIQLRQLFRCPVDSELEILEKVHERRVKGR